MRIALISKFKLFSFQLSYVLPLYEKLNAFLNILFHVAYSAIRQGFKKKCYFYFMCLDVLTELCIVFASDVYGGQKRAQIPRD